MYNFGVREYLNMREYRYYSSPIKTDEDRIKPRKPRSIKEEKKLAYVYDNPFTGEEIVEYMNDDKELSRSLAATM